MKFNLESTDLSSIPALADVAAGDPELNNTVVASLSRLNERGGGDKEKMLSLKFNIVRYLGFDDRISLSNLENSTSYLTQKESLLLLQTQTRLADKYRHYFSPARQAILPEKTKADKLTVVTPIEESGVIGVFFEGLSEGAKQRLDEVVSIASSTATGFKNITEPRTLVTFAVLGGLIWLISRNN